MFAGCIFPKYIVGLRHLYQIVSQGHYELRIGNMDPAFDSVYRIFKLGDSGTKYQLTVDDYYGTIGKRYCNVLNNLIFCITSPYIV